MTDPDAAGVRLPGLAGELATAPGLTLTLSPLSAFQLAALIQLALRHPAVADHVRDTGRRFLEGIRGQFAECPNVLEVLRQGDDPTCDVGELAP